MTISLPDLTGYTNLRLVVALAAPEGIWEPTHRDSLHIIGGTSFSPVPEVACTAAGCVPVPGVIDSFLPPVYPASLRSNVYSIDLDHQFQDFEYTIDSSLTSLTFAFASTDYPEIIGIDSVRITGEQVKAATFCVNTADQLHSALSAAESNGQDDVIRIVQGTYNGTFVYGSAEAFGLTIEGGYTADCTSRFVNPVNTVLDGGGSGAVLALSAPTALAGFIVDGLKIQDGYVVDRKGGGIFISTAYGNVLLRNNEVTNNIVQQNMNTAEGGGIYIYGANIVTVNNNLITSNSSIGVLLVELA